MRTETVDPVCGMTPKPDTPHRHVHGEVEYLFCSAHCVHKFAADPAKYLEPDLAEPEPVVEGAVYTCPMHPEVEQVGPGTTMGTPASTRVASCATTFSAFLRALSRSPPWRKGAPQQTS